MTNRFLVSLGLASLGLLLNLSTASGADAGRMPPKYVRIAQVDLADREAFTKVMKNWSAYVKKEFPNDPGWECSFAATGQAFFVRFADDWGAFQKDEQIQARQLEAHRSSGQPNLMAEWLKSHTSGSSAIWEIDADLSYLPGPWPSVEDQPFRRVIILHLKRDRVETCEKALKTLNEIDRKNGITTPRAVMRLKVGNDAPAIGLVIPAKDVFDHYAGLAKRRTIRRADPMWKDVDGVMQASARSAENHQLVIQPELSNLH